MTLGLSSFPLGKTTKLGWVWIVKFNVYRYQTHNVSVCSRLSMRLQGRLRVSKQWGKYFLKDTQISLKTYIYG